jgi:periplasmic divalent cation tolerance protein
MVISSLMPPPYPAAPGIHARQDPGMGDEECCEVVITADDADRLVALTRTLVEERLAACGQTVTGVRSIYRWEGEVHDDPEARVALHTRRSLVPAVVERTRSLHTYEVPCVIALPLVDGNPDYLRWVVAETREP